MTNNTSTRRMLKQVYAGVTIFSCLTMMAVAQTSTTEKIQGTAETTTVKLSGVVTYIEGNTFVAKMSGGGLRTFTVPDSLKFVIDGKTMTVHDIKPGTTLSADVVTTKTPITERTTTVLTGTVWFVAGNSVILTLPDGKNKMYQSEPDFKFKVDGQDASVNQLRKGMRISAEKIVEEPITEVATDTTVYGSAPKP